MSDLDSDERIIVKDRDNQRLKIMEKYCYTTECLRNYILKYFGETPEKPCENCGNCLREFETIDMTNAAKQIINCVYEAKGRYGKNIIIDTVAGAKTARLEEIGTMHYKTYGILADIKKNMLRRLMEQLILEGYLLVGDYQVIKLGDINKLKNSETHILVKITDDDKLKEKVNQSSKKEKGMELLNSNGFKLFDRFRKLRLEIAREEHMPPYIIFNDKTLIDMALKIPTSQSEMLNVSGVGENKFEKYGERFLAVIDECIEEIPELLQSKIENSNINIFNNEQYTKTKKKGKQEIFLTAEESKAFNYKKYYYISEIRDEMNRICNRTNVKKIPATKIAKFLCTEGLIIEVEKEGRYVRIPTEKGFEIGIKEVEKVSEKGNVYTILIYPMQVQQLIIQNYIEPKIIKESNFEDE